VNLLIETATVADVKWNNGTERSGSILEYLTLTRMSLYVEIPMIDM
jgi:hypothetical protein